MAHTHERDHCVHICVNESTNRFVAVMHWKMPGSSGSIIVMEKKEKVIPGKELCGFRGYLGRPVSEGFKAR